MARVLNIFSAKWDGSAGFGTFRQLGGQTIVSQKSLGPTNEKTPIQIGQEKSMATLVEGGRQIKGSIDIAFNELRIKNTPKKCRNTAWGAYIGENRKASNAVFAYTDPANPTFQAEQFIAAKGTIEKTLITTATADESLQTVTVTWATSSDGSGQSPLDCLGVVLYNATTNQWTYSVGQTARSVGTETVTVGPAAGFEFDIADDLYAYIYFYDTVDGDFDRPAGKASDSDSMIVTISA